MGGQPDVAVGEIEIKPAAACAANVFGHNRETMASQRMPRGINIAPANIHGAGARKHVATTEQFCLATGWCDAAGS